MTRLIDKMRGGRAAVLAAVLFVAGSGVGAGAMYAARPVAVMGPVVIRPIATLATTTGEGPFADDRIASVRGRVAEVYGSRFTLADASGKALVEAGPRGRGGLVAVGQTVTVQGRYGDGVMHAAYLVGADGTVTALDRGPRHHGPHGPGGPRPGARGDRPAAPPPAGDRAVPPADAPEA